MINLTVCDYIDDVNVFNATRYVIWFLQRGASVDFALRRACDEYDADPDEVYRYVAQYFERTGEYD